MLFFVLENKQGTWELTVENDLSQKFQNTRHNVEKGPGTSSAEEALPQNLTDKRELQKTLFVMISEILL